MVQLNNASQSQFPSCDREGQYLTSIKNLITITGGPHDCMKNLSESTKNVSSRLWSTHHVIATNNLVKPRDWGIRTYEQDEGSRAIPVDSKLA